MRGYNIPRRLLDYSHFPTQEEIQMVRNYQVQLQLLSGWLPLGEDRIVYELIAASLLCVSDLNSSFLIPDPLFSTEHAFQFQLWKQFLERNKFPLSSLKRECVIESESRGGGGGGDGPGDYQIDLLTFCNCLMQENRNYFSSLQPLVVILSFINALIPFLFVIHRFNSLCTSAQIYYLTSGFLNLLFYWACVGFLIAALEDSTRRYFCAEKLAAFIRAIDLDIRLQLRFQSHGPSHQLLECQSSKLQTLVKQNSFQSSPQADSQDQQLEQGILKRSLTSFEISSSPVTNQLFTSFASSSPPSSPSSSPCPHSTASPPLTLPALKLAEYPDNVIVWMYARKLLHNFGARIRFRLDTYCGEAYTLLNKHFFHLTISPTGGIILLLLTLVLGMIYSIISHSASSSNSSINLFASPAFIQFLLFITVFTIFQALVIFIGHLTNKTLESHG
jgi:hypothetical protein